MLSVEFSYIFLIPLLAYHLNINFPKQVLNETLSLSKVTRETAGIYKCHMSNSEGNLTHTTQLQVKGQLHTTSCPHGQETQQHQTE